MQDLNLFVNTGLAGIAFACIVLLGLFVRMFFKFMGSKISDSTKATQEHTDVLREHTSVLREHIGVLREFKEWLMKQNGKH